MWLASVDEIRDDLGFDNMTDINEAIGAALHAAEPILAARIGSEFGELSVTDTFYVDEPGYVRGRSVQTEFRLTRGFVQTVSALGRADTLDALGTSSEVSYLGDVIQDKEKGVIRDFKTPYQRMFVRVAYTAGFPAASGDANSYDLEKVPTWLQQAAKLRAKLLLAGSPSLESAQIKIDVKTLTAELNALLANKVRYAPVALLPM